jgi:hypothetical protein
MVQQSFDFQRDEDRFIHHQLDEQQYQSLVDLMATLIITVFQTLKHCYYQGINPNRMRHSFWAGIANTSNSPPGQTRKGRFSLRRI